MKRDDRVMIIYELQETKTCSFRITSSETNEKTMHSFLTLRRRLRGWIQAR